MSINFETERKRESASGGGAVREGERERIPSRLRADSAEPDAGLSLTNREIMTGAKVKSWLLNGLSHPGAPEFLFIQFQTFTGELPYFWYCVCCVGYKMN